MAKATAEVIVRWYKSDPAWCLSGQTRRLRFERLRGPATVTVTQGGTVHTLVLVPETGPVPKGRRKRKSKAFPRELDLQASTFNGSPLATLEQADTGSPHVFLDAIAYTEGKRSLLAKPIRVPIAADAKSGSYALTLSAEGKTQEIHFVHVVPNRTRPLRDKFQDWLEHTSTLIYGAASSRYDKAGDCYVTSNYEWRYRASEKKLLLSATGNTSPGLVCSPYVAQFLGYWFNYAHLYTDTTGYDGKTVVAPTGSINTRLDSKPNINGYGALLEKLSAEGAAGKKRGYGKYRFSEWYQEHFSKAAPGDMFVCDSGGHVWVIAALGEGFTVPRRLIFGQGCERASEACEPGLYTIQANGPSDMDLRLRLYTTKTPAPSGQFSVDALRAAIAKYAQEDPEAATLAGVPWKTIVSQLKLALRKIGTSSVVKVHVINGTPLIDRLGRYEVWASSWLRELGVRVRVGAHGLEVVGLSKLPPVYNAKRKAYLLKKGDVISAVGGRSLASPCLDPVALTLEVLDAGREQAGGPGRGRFKVALDVQRGKEAVRVTLRVRRRPLSPRVRAGELACAKFYGRDSLGGTRREPFKAKARFKVFRVRQEVLDPATGLVRAGAPGLPEEAWVCQRRADNAGWQIHKLPIDLSRHGVKPLEARDERGEPKRY